MNAVREVCHEIHDYYPSIMHIDGTSRIQEVTEEPHKTLLEEEKNCLSMLLNTSLNIRETIINNKAEAKNFEVKTGKVL